MVQYLTDGAPPCHTFMLGSGADARDNIRALANETGRAGTGHPPRPPPTPATMLGATPAVGRPRVPPHVPPHGAGPLATDLDPTRG